MENLAAVDPASSAPKSDVKQVMLAAGLKVIGVEATAFPVATILSSA
jgi:hypothetical protein